MPAPHGARRRRMVPTLCVRCQICFPSKTHLANRRALRTAPAMAAAAFLSVPRPAAVCKAAGPARSQRLACPVQPLRAQASRRGARHSLRLRAEQPGSERHDEVQQQQQQQQQQDQHEPLPPPPLPSSPPPPLSGEATQPAGRRHLRLLITLVATAGEAELCASAMARLGWPAAPAAGGMLGETHAWSAGSGRASACRSALFSAVPSRHRNREPASLQGGNGATEQLCKLSAGLPGPRTLALQLRELCCLCVHGTPPSMDFGAFGL